MLLCVFSCFMFVSCNSESLNKSDFQEVSFKEEQKIQLVTDTDVYNISVSFNEDGEFNMHFLEEAPEIYDDLEINIKNDMCVIESNGLKFAKNINDFNNDYFPKIIYHFFIATDFINETYSYNELEKTASLEKSVLEKKVVFTTQLSLENTAQIYKIEIKS